MASTEVLELQWLEHANIFNEAIVGLRNKGSFTDATLACEGKFYPVHKFVLSTCSEYFNAIFEWTPCVNPVVVINNISNQHLEPLLDFMYRGETNVQECNIHEVMKAAECLHIKGLSLRTEETLLAKNRAKSPMGTDEPEKKRRKSEGSGSQKRAPFLKPLLLHQQQQQQTSQHHQIQHQPLPPPHHPQLQQLHQPQHHQPHQQHPNPTQHLQQQQRHHPLQQEQQQQQNEDVYCKLEISPLHSSSTIPPPTPPPSTPIHYPSPHHTPPVPSPSLHSASPMALSSTASSPSGQSQFQIAPLQIPSPKSTLTLATHNLTHPVITHPAKNLSPFSDASSSSTSQSQGPSQSTEVYSPHTQEHISGLKDEQPSLGITSLASVIASSRASALLSFSQAQENAQFQRSHSSVSERILSDSGIHSEVQGDTPNFGNLEPKVIGIAEELHLEGSVKELEIATEDGTVSIPEILEGLVDMRQLYDSKNDAFSHDSKSSGINILPQCSTDAAEPSGSLLTFKEETNDNMYDFTEEFTEDSGLERMKLLKEKPHKVYSNFGTNMKRKFTSDLGDLPSSILSRNPGNGETSRATPSQSPPLLSLSEEPPNRKVESKGGPFVCGTCNRVCKKKDSLTRHMRTHMEFPYTCTVCSHKCKVYKDFIVHRKTHATKRCDKCDFVTIRNDNLRRHMITHSEEKSHKCPYPECSYSTSRANLLSSHVQNNHTKKPKREEN